MTPLHPKGMMNHPARYANIQQVRQPPKPASPGTPGSDVPLNLSSKPTTTAGLLFSWLIGFIALHRLKIKINEIYAVAHMLCIFRDIFYLHFYHFIDAWLII